MPIEFRATLACRASVNHLRARHGHEHSRVTNVELFFDLVFVFAVTQLSHGLLAHLTPLGALQIAVLMFAVWWAWIDTAWITNWLDPERTAVRLLLFALMLVGLVMSASIPKAFEERAWAFALAYVAEPGRPQRVHAVGAEEPRPEQFPELPPHHRLAEPPQRCSGSPGPSHRARPGWPSGPLRSPSTAFGPIVGFPVPGLGRSATTDWAVEGGHMAERCALFVIIALGESVLVTGATFAGLAWTAEHIGAFLVAFAGSVAMWVIYFNIGAERGSRQIASSGDPGRLARNGYTYLHILIVAGIIVAAVGDELVLHHPGGHTDLKTAIVLLGGPALYLLGNLLFKRLSAPNSPLSHSSGLACSPC